MNSKEEERISVIYTFLDERGDSVTVEDICSNVQGLSRRTTETERALDTMCENGLVVKTNGRYTLASKISQPGHGAGLTGNPQLPSPRAQRSYDGATSSPSTYEQSPGASRTYGAVVVRNPNTTVAVQQSSTSQQSMVTTCDSQLCVKYTDYFKKILAVLPPNTPMKAKDIAQKSKIGSSRSDVNRYLYFLAEKGYIQKTSGSEWELKETRAVSGDDLMVYGAELAKCHSGTSSRQQTRQETGQPNTECSCPNAGRGCMHLHQHNMQQIHNHNYINMTVGDNNIFTTPTNGVPDFPPPRPPR